MKKIILPILMICFFATSSLFAQTTLGTIKDNVSKTLGGSNVTALTESEIAAGLKEALTVGSKNAAQMLNKTDGFNLNPKVRIPFPEDVKIVATKLRSIGYGKKVDDFERTLNRAAEKAAKEASPIFVNAITSMTVYDAKNILTGGDNAATVYLQDKTNKQLYDAFLPHVNSALKTTLATAKWKELTTLYNRIPMVKKVDTDLGRYTTNKALKGLFLVVAEEELKIRKDPAARVSDILQKVFGRG